MVLQVVFVLNCLLVISSELHNLYIHLVYLLVKKKATRQLATSTSMEEGLAKLVTCSDIPGCWTGVWRRGTQLMDIADNDAPYGGKIWRGI